MGIRKRTELVREVVKMETRDGKGRRDDGKRWCLERDRKNAER